MASLVLSEEEKHFIISGIEVDFRSDGRSCEDYRMISVETGVISTTSGSSQVKLVSVCISLFFCHVGLDH